MNLTKQEEVVISTMLNDMGFFVMDLDFGNKISRSIMTPLDDMHSLKYELEVVSETIENGIKTINVNMDIEGFVDNIKVLSYRIESTNRKCTIKQFDMEHAINLYNSILTFRDVAFNK